MPNRQLQINSPSRSQARRTGLTSLRLGLLLLVIGAFTNDAFLLAVALGLIVFVMVSWTWDVVSLMGVSYERQFFVNYGLDGESRPMLLSAAGEARAFLGEQVTLSVCVHNRKLVPLSWLEAVDTVPGPLSMYASSDLTELDRESEPMQIPVNPLTRLGEFRSFWRLGAFQRLTRRYIVNCEQRGYHTYGPVTISTGDGFGLFQRAIKLDASQRLIVYPRLYTLQELRLPADYPFGARATQARLFEDPLRTAGVREWVPDDGLRRIHWKATAHNQRMLSRIYEPSREPQMLVCLNVATLPRYWEGIIPETLERAISVAASLAALCTERRMPVGLLANGTWPGSDQILRLMPGRSPEQLMRILEMLAAVSGFANRALEELLPEEAMRLPWGSTLLVVTPLAHEDLLRALLTLKRNGLKVVLFTLTEEPPETLTSELTVHHLSHLVEDLMVLETLG